MQNIFFLQVFNSIVNDFYIKYIFWFKGESNLNTDLALNVDLRFFIRRYI